MAARSSPRRAALADSGIGFGKMTVSADRPGIGRTGRAMCCDNAMPQPCDYTDTAGGTLIARPMGPGATGTR